MLRRSALALLSAAVVSTALAPPPAAAADPGRDVGLQGFRDILVDDTHGRVFISQGTDTIVVTDLDGIATDVVTGLPGASGMALSDDDTTLYVAAAGADAVGVVDTATLTVETIHTGVDTCPRDLALTAGMVWFTHGCVRTEGIGALDPGDASVHPALTTISSARWASAVIDSSPGRPDELFAATDAGLYSFTAEGGEFPSLTPRLERPGRHPVDFTISPDGSRLVSTAGSTSREALALSTEDFSPVDTYLLAPDAQVYAVTYRDDGMLAVGGDAYNRPDVLVFEAGSTTPMRRYDLGDEPSVTSRGSTFGDKRLYLVTNELGDLFLEVIEPRLEPALEVRSGGRTFDYGERAMVSVTLDGGDTNRAVEVFAHRKGEKKVLIARGDVPTGGALVTPFEVTRPTWFSATYAGDDTFDPAEDETKTVEVKADLRTTMIRPRGTAGRYHLYRVAQRATLQAKLLPKGFPDRCVTIRLQYFARGRWGYDAKTSCLTPDRRARVRAYLAGSRQLVGIPLRMRAEFRGDKVHTKTITSWSYLKFKR